MPNPKRVLILRHAEKPKVVGDINLSTRGMTRAVALSVLIPEKFGRPDIIIATHVSAESDRPRLTMAPLGLMLGIEIRTSHGDAEYGDVATALLTNPKYADLDIVVCWHHGKIPELAAALGVKDPPAWSDDVFDRMWFIEFDSGSRPTLRDAPQKLLFGDSDA